MIPAKQEIDRLGQTRIGAEDAAPAGFFEEGIAEGEAGDEGQPGLFAQAERFDAGRVIGGYPRQRPGGPQSEARGQTGERDQEENRQRNGSQQRVSPLPVREQERDKAQVKAN